MPLRLRHILDRLPLPSLRYYTLISTSILFGNIFYFHHLIQTNIKNETNSNETIFFSDAKPFSFTYIETLLSIVISQTLSLLVRKKSSRKNKNIYIYFRYLLMQFIVHLVYLLNIFKNLYLVNYV